MVSTALIIFTGLRVAKEDKHNNLLKGRLLKARSRAVTAISDDNEVSNHGGSSVYHMNSYENQIAVKRQEEKPSKLRLRSVAKREDVKLPRRRLINCPTGTQVTEPESLSLSPTSCDSEEQTSSGESVEPEFAMTPGNLDSFSISIRAYTDADSLSSSLDNVYGSHSLSQNQCYENTPPLTSNVLGVQEFSSLAQEYTPFVQREHFDYYDHHFFAQDGTLAPFVEGHRAHDKVAELHLATGSAHLNHAINGNGCFEAEYGLSRRRDGTTTDLIARDDGDVDFSKWLLTVEAQDGKDNSVVGQTESMLGGPRVAIQQSHSEFDGGPSGPRIYPDVLGTSSVLWLPRPYPTTHVRFSQ